MKLYLSSTLFLGCWIFCTIGSTFAETEPTWEEKPQRTLKVAVGQDTKLTCRVNGVPKPVISWQYMDEDIAVQGQKQINPRFTVLRSGDLRIVNIYEADGGTYECKAVNKFGEISSSAILIVRDPTIIIMAPESQLVKASSTLMLKCHAITDAKEMSHLNIEWKYEGQFIDYTSNPRIIKSVRDGSLKIIDIIETDTGDYTCVADNGIDSDEVTATINVQDN